MSEAIKIDGLIEFRKALKQIDAGLPKTLRLAMNQAADVVVTAVRPRIPSVTGRARGSVRSSSTQERARVSEGSRKAPWMPWLDYGGEGRRRGRPAKRPFVKQGRYLYPVYFAKRDSGEFTTILSMALDDVVRAAGLEVT